MSQAGNVVAQTKAKLAESVHPGMTTQELDKIAELNINKLGATPSFKGYLGFPATICVSINEQIVHGIPSDRVIKKGDIVSIDVGAIVHGFHSDSAFTIGIGEISSKAQNLIESTKEALKRGIEQAQEGARIGDVSSAIQNYAENLGYGVVRQYVGHGIGRALHEDPQVPNYGLPGRGPVLKTGMAIAIEPMLNIGGAGTIQLEDGWTVVTADGTLSAHFEDTIAITNDGTVVLTEI